MKLIMILDEAAQTPTSKVRAALMELLISSPVASNLIDGALALLDNGLSDLDDILSDIRSSRDPGMLESAHMKPTSFLLEGVQVPTTQVRTEIMKLVTGDPGEAFDDILDTINTSLSDLDAVFTTEGRYLSEFQ